MIQQVNLYKNILNQEQATPVLKNYLYGLIAIIFLVMSYSLFLIVENNGIKNNITHTKQQLITAESDLNSVQIKYPKKTIDPLLVQELSHSKMMLNNLSKVVHMLNDKSSDQVQGFSRYFSALANQSMAAVWLTDIDIDGKNNTILLQGSTYQAEKTAVFLQQLHHEKAFQGRSFAKLSMTQSEHDENLLNFIINTTDATLEQDSHD